MNKYIKINGTSVGEKFPPYIVAEMSANHNGDIKNAFQIIKSAKENGAHAVKIQTYRPNTITIESDREDFKTKDGLGKGKTLYEWYDWVNTPWD